MSSGERPFKILEPTEQIEGAVVEDTSAHVSYADGTLGVAFFANTGGQIEFDEEI